MLQNIPKRPMADPWSLSTTTAGVPGEQSVAEQEREYALSVASGKVRNPQFFYFHREAGSGHDLGTYDGRRDAVLEASGPVVAAWSDVDSIVALSYEPATDLAYWERVWLNRWVASARQAFDPDRWSKDLARPERRAVKREKITLGFDGARWRDACALVATDIESGWQWPVQIWERPANLPDASEWEVTDEQVDGAVDETFTTYRVVLMYCDPPRFEANTARWSGRYGAKRVVDWYTNRPTHIGRAMRAYRTAMATGEVTHSGDPTFARHIANARRYDLKLFDEDDTPLWTIAKERPDSKLCVDAAMAGCLSWQARLDAMGKGLWRPRSAVTIHH
jgi:phage terminase large subunit-like protein